MDQSDSSSSSSGVASRQNLRIGVFSVIIDYCARILQTIGVPFGASLGEKELHSIQQYYKARRGVDEAIGGIGHIAVVQGTTDAKPREDEVFVKK